ncbi:hypothetical protein [Metabacillus sp. RGM 3146]|uniref:hypothetical protein n=1 Tax=Metabacillus sp. RGM 3146 TaxID=3401092 RepID=UPI003B9D3AD4
MSDLNEELGEEIPIKEESDQAAPSEAMPKRPLNTGNKFDQLMFGKGNSSLKRQENRSSSDDITVNSENKEEVNYLHIMGQLDEIMISLKELKPVLKEFSPIVDIIKKKLK